MGMQDNNNKILNSWKDISKYLNYDQRTCNRWEKQLGLPVHRYSNSSRSKVFAYKDEIDKWLRGKKTYSTTISKPKKNIILSMIALLFLISTIAIFYLYIDSKKIDTFNHKIPSIAILPFENLNSSEYDTYLAQGISKELINYLGLSRYIRAIPISSHSELEYFNKTSPNSIDFNIDYLLTGSLKRERKEIIISVSLENVHDKKVLFVKEKKTSLSNINKFKRDIFSSICETIDIPVEEILPSMVMQTGPVNNEAFDNYLKGNFILKHIRADNSDPWKLYHEGNYYYGLSTKESNELAIELFNKAIVKDGKFAQAYIGLSRCYLNNINFGWNNNIRWLNKSEDLLVKAQSLTPDLPDYFCSLTNLFLLKYLCFNAETKDKAFKIAIKGLNFYPNNPTLNAITSYIYFLKYGEKGIESDFMKALIYAEKSFWQNPFSINNLFYVKLLMFNEEYEKGLEICDLTKKISPSSITDFRIGELYYYAGDLKKSESIFSAFKEPFILKVSSIYYLGMIAAQNKDISKAREFIKQLENISTGISDEYYKLSSIYFGIGDMENGFNLLDQFFKKVALVKNKYQYKKYFLADKNYNMYIDSIRRKYFER